MRKTILGAVLIFWASAAFAEDFVVTQKNDTVKGLVNIQTYGNVDRIQVTTLERKKVVFTAIQVKMVFLGNEVYHPVRTDHGYRMMKLVRQGYVSLYLGRKGNSITGAEGYAYDTQYLVKRDGTSIEVPNLSFKKTMANFLDECQVMKQKIQKEELGRKDLDRIISEFNLCIDDQTKAAISARPVVSQEDPKIIALSELRSSIDVSTISGKGDALDIVSDMIEKTKHNQSVPKYQLDGLRGILKDSPDLSEKFDRVAALLTK